jgi:hypothetical protein
MVEPDGLGLSPRLCTDIRYWQKWYDGVSHLAYEAKFAVLGDRFDEVGMQLAKRVQEELGPGYQVVYQAQGGWRLAHPNTPVSPISVSQNR